MLVTVIPVKRTGCHQAPSSCLSDTAQNYWPVFFFISCRCCPRALHMLGASSYGYYTPSSSYNSTVLNSLLSSLKGAVACHDRRSMERALYSLIFPYVLCGEDSIRIWARKRLIFGSILGMCNSGRDVAKAGVFSVHGPAPTR